MSLAHITLATRDVARTSRFFAATLGWQPIDRPSNIPMRAAWLRITADQELHLIELADFAPSPFEREYGCHIALRIPKTELAAIRERLRREGAEISEALRPTEHERFFFRDPNGYVFEVIGEE